MPSVGSDDLAELAALTAGAAGAARAAQAAVVLEADARGVVNASDHLRVHAWVAQSQRDADTPVTPGLCRALDRVARVTDRYDLAPLRQAFAAGRVPVEAAEQVAASYALLQKSITVDFWELILTGLIGWAADGADRRDLHAFEEQLTGQYATTAELEDREDRHRRRDFTSFFPTRDGMREARIVLDPGAEAVLTAAITALSAPQPGPTATPTSAARVPGAPTPSSPSRAWPPGQRKTSAAAAPRPASSSPFHCVTCSPASPTCRGCRASGVSGSRPTATPAAAPPDSGRP